MTGPAGRETSSSPYLLHLVLGHGFAGHRVVVTMDDRVVYEAVAVTTDPSTRRAAAVSVTSAASTARVRVSVSPGCLASSIDVDIAAHPHLAVSLVGARTLAFDMSAARLPAAGAPPPAP